MTDGLVVDTLMDQSITVSIGADGVFFTSANDTLPPAKLVQVRERGAAHQNDPTSNSDRECQHGFCRQRPRHALMPQPSAPFRAVSMGAKALHGIEPPGRWLQLRLVSQPREYRCLCPCPPTG